MVASVRIAKRARVCNESRGVKFHQHINVGGWQGATCAPVLWDHRGGAGVGCAWNDEGNVDREARGGEGKKKGFRNYRRPLWSPSTLAPSAPISTNCYRIRETPELSGLMSRVETIRDFEHLLELISCCWRKVKISFFLVILILRSVIDCEDCEQCSILDILLLYR